MVVRAYRSDRREAQARATRKRVLDAATEVFTEFGFPSTTIAEVARRAGVAVATVELLFGRKADLLKAAIDRAIVGDDEPLGVLEREPARIAERASTDEALVAQIASTLAAAQLRSGGLVLSLFEAARTDPELRELATRMSAARAVTAAWIVDQIARLGPLRPEVSRRDAIDTVWVLMDSAVFERLTRQRRRSTAYYERWIGDSLLLLLRDPTPPRPLATPQG